MIVPSITDTSLWHSPALTMRTRTSSCSGPRTSTSSRTSSSPVQTIPFIADSPRSSSRPDERLELAVGVHGEAAAVAADARLLEPAERRLGGLLGGVDGDAARAELAGDPDAAPGVAAEHVVVEPELGAVGERHRLVLVLERQHDDDGPEDLLLHHRHAGLAVGDEGGGHVEAGV